jgi:N-acetylmuramoyl-L-alanine amidase
MTSFNAPETTTTRRTWRSPLRPTRPWSSARNSYDRGIKRARFVVIRETKIPAVLVEGGFLSHSFDAKIIATPEYRQQMAASIVLAVNNYRRAVGGGAATPVASTQAGASEPRVRLNSDAVAPRSESSVPNAASGKN